MSTAPDQIDVVPDDEQLTRISRDLRFLPADPALARTLSAEQIGDYNSKGFLRPLNLYSHDDIADIRNWFNDLLAETIGAGGNSDSISTAHLKYGRVYDILTDRRIVDLLGPNVEPAVHTSSAKCRETDGRLRGTKMPARP